LKRFVQSSVPCYAQERHVSELLGKRLLEQRLATIANAIHHHATSKRQYGFGKMWLGMVGNLVENYGITLYDGDDHRTIEEGGPQWLTWRDIAAIIAQKTRSPKIRIIPLPS
jgi:hypothetical protein